MPGKHIFFASDFHLRVAADANGHDRERKIVRWLNSIENDAAEIYLLGDLFDFWFEYRHVVPKGFVRLQGKLAEMSDKGIIIHLFTGNHDVWMFDYFPKELGAKVYRQAITREIAGKRFVIGHGDGLGPGDHGYKLIKRVFSNRFAQKMFAAIHPYIGVSLARFFSRKSRESTGDKDDTYLGDEKEFLVRYCREYVQSHEVDFFIFGHRHLVIDMEVVPGSRYVNLGEWFKSCHYVRFDGQQLTMHRFEG